MTSIEVIADVGDNWHWFDDLLKCVKIAKWSGADVFKIQYFDMSDLYFQKPSDSKKSLIDLERLKNCCDDHGIEFLASVFNPLDVQALNPYVKRFKVASCEARNYALLSEISKTGKPCIVSTGAINVPIEPVDFLTRYFDKDQLTLLYCEVEYPCRTAKLSTIDSLKAMGVGEVGFSDHSYDLYVTAKQAVYEFGCRTIERHINPLNLGNTKDCGAHSLSARDFKSYVDALKWGNTSLRDYPKIPRSTPVAIDFIQIGEPLVYGKNWLFYRSDEYYLRQNIFDVDETYFAIDQISYGEPISWCKIGIYPA